MDPNEALARIREICDKFNAGEFTFGQAAAQMSTLIELIDGLHQWITSGGFLPLRWDKPRVVELSGIALTALLNDVGNSLDTMCLAVTPQGDGKRTVAYKMNASAWSAQFDEGDGAKVHVVLS